MVVQWNVRAKQFVAASSDLPATCMGAVCEKPPDVKLAQLTANGSALTAKCLIVYRLVAARRIEQEWRNAKWRQVLTFDFVPSPGENGRRHPGWIGRRPPFRRRWHAWRIGVGRIVPGIGISWNA